MPFMNVTVVDPLRDGTPIYDVSDGVEHKRKIGFSNNWSVRWRVPNKGGCPSWIDQIVVGQNPEVLARTVVQAVQMPAVASSSMSSRDVIAIMLNEDGFEDTRKVIPYVYVGKYHSSGKPDQITSLPVPIADELWFSQKPVDDKAVLEAEGACNHSL